MISKRHDARALRLGLRRKYAKKRNNETNGQKRFHVVVWLAVTSGSDGTRRHLRIARSGVSGSVAQRIGGPELAHGSSGASATGGTNGGVSVLGNLRGGQRNGLGATLLGEGEPIALVHGETPL